MAFDIYSAVTERIIQQLEKGWIPWMKPWGGIQSGAISGTTGKPYSLLNQMILEKPGTYYTYNQVCKLGGLIRKGEKASMVVFWKQLPVKQQNPQTGELEETLIPMLRYYNVFHISQCEGLVEPVAEPAEPIQSPEADTVINNYIRHSGVTFTHQKGDEAFYSPAKDSVTLPLAEQFQSREEYYSTAFHELAHSTGHSSRLNRLNTTAHFGSTEYSKEELVAEISAAALMSLVGLETRSTFRNSAAYIQSWLSVLRQDKRMIVTASGAAAKAVDFILGQGESKDVCA